MESAIIPACPICLEPMLRPYALPCMHNVCSRCVPAMKASKSGRQRCPVCRRSTARPYVPNFALINANEHLLVLAAVAGIAVDEYKPSVKKPWYRRLLSRRRCK